MYKKFLVLVILMLTVQIHSTASTPVPLTDSLPTDSSYQSKVRFNLCYTSLLYWWNRSNLQEKQIAYQDSIITTYEVETGAQANSVEELKKVIDNKEAIAEDMCNERVEKAVAPIEKKKKAWRKTAVVVGVVAVVEGVIIYLITL